MIMRGRWRLGAAMLGVVCLGLGVFHLAAARQISGRYDLISSGTQERAARGKGADPRALGLLLRALGDLRHETHEHLARGILGAAGGMTLLALGSQGLLAGRRRASRRSIDGHLRVEDGSSARSDDHGAIAATHEVLDDEEQALLARFDALEKRALMEQQR